MTDNIGRIGIAAPSEVERAPAGIEVSGLVRRAVRLGPDELAALPRVVVREQAGSGGAAVEWTGPALRDVLALAEPETGARFVLVGSGSFTAAIRLEDGAVLCDRLDGGPLPAEQGGPWRLLVQGSQYFTSVKRVDRLVVSAEEPDATAPSIARARIAARAANPALAGVSCSCLDLLED